MASLTASNPYSGNPTEPIANYLANPVEEGILHFVDADPARTPTLAMFAKPDYFLQSARAVGRVQGSARLPDHRVRMGSRRLRRGDQHQLRRLRRAGREAARPGRTDRQRRARRRPGANSGQTVVADNHFRGPWADETDIRPTMMYLTGLRDDYEHDGRVITQILTRPERRAQRPGVTTLGECYKQLNSSVGDFGAATLVASTNAIESTSTGDSTFSTVDSQLRGLEVARDHLAGLIKGELEAAAFQDKPIFGSEIQLHACRALIHAAGKVASAS